MISKNREVESLTTDSELKKEVDKKPSLQNQLQRSWRKSGSVSRKAVESTLEKHLE